MPALSITDNYKTERSDDRLCVDSFDQCVYTEVRTHFASAISPKGAGQIGYSSMALCSSLSLHQEPHHGSAPERGERL